jgi:hypothetical protein
MNSKATMIIKAGAVAILGCTMTYSGAKETSITDGRLLYKSALTTQEDVKEWIMEGPGQVTFGNGWMRMFSPGMQGSHVFWCPYIFPDSFIAQWEIQNLNPRSGLLIVFFSAAGSDNQDIFHPSLRMRDGTFSQYTKGDIRAYHISYYANSLSNPDRGTMNLRKNPGFHLVAQSQSPINSDSVAIHSVRLEKDGARIEFYIDNKLALNWTDTGKQFGRVLSGGRIGFRQMPSTDFQYRNLRVFAIRDKDSTTP